MGAQLIDGVWGDGDERRASGSDFCKRIAQLREVPAAERSGEAPEEDEYDGPAHSSIFEGPCRFLA